MQAEALSLFSLHNAQSNGRALAPPARRAKLPLIIMFLLLK